MTSQIKKTGLTVLAGLGLFVGAAGIATAATGTDNAPDGPAVETGIEDEADDDGVDCENGIDTATGDECDGGPGAAEADEANEAPDGAETEAEADDEADDGVDHQFEGEEIGENGDGVADADEAAEVETD